jgi:hypothetical protein
LYSHLRFVIAAALIAFGGVIAVGVPALLLAVDRPLLAQTDVSEPPAASCAQQSWLHFDRTVPSAACPGPQHADHECRPGRGRRLNRQPTSP